MNTYKRLAAKSGKLIVFGVILALLVIAFLFFRSQGGTLGSLKNLGFQTESKEVTFEGKKSTRISGTKDTIQVAIQEVDSVSQGESQRITGSLNSQVTDLNQKFTVIDPYSGRQSDFSVPPNLSPVKKELRVQGKALDYYEVYSNEILSLKIFSPSEVKYIGIFSVFYCENLKKAERVEIFDLPEKYSADTLTGLLSSLYCK